MNTLLIYLILNGLGRWEFLTVERAPGDLDQRLTHAGNYLAHVQDHEVPEEHRKELGEIKAIMFATPLSSERGYSARQISTEDGTKLAHRILELYTKVMGGL
jgi:hypothetical protein